MIDKSSGHLEIGNLTIGPDSTVDQLCEDFDKLGNTWKLDSTGNGRACLWFGNLIARDLYFSGNIYFDSAAIESIQFVVGREKQEVDPWKNWTEEREILKAREMTNWLRGCVGTETKFPWGMVWSGYDARSGGAEIGIRYARKSA